MIAKSRSLKKDSSRSKNTRAGAKKYSSDDPKKFAEIIQESLDNIEKKFEGLTELTPGGKKIRKLLRKKDKNKIRKGT